MMSKYAIEAENITISYRTVKVSTTENYLNFRKVFSNKSLMP